MSIRRDALAEKAARVAAVMAIRGNAKSCPRPIELIVASRAGRISSAAKSQSRRSWSASFSDLPPQKLSSTP